MAYTGGSKMKKNVKMMAMPKAMKPKAKTAKKGKGKLAGLKFGSPAYMKALRDMKKK
tara:strand:+ start:591 stop:761 length:171 start_codon:yes stop_codon:yes gene_type:complete